MTDVETAAKALDQARRRHIQAQKRHFEEVVAPKLRKLVGRHLIYRGNCYSCPSKPSDYWDSYGRVEKVDGSSVVLTTVEVDSYGVPLLRHSAAVSWDGELPSGWEATTKKRFDAEVRRILKMLRVGTKP